jgi:queuine/archaeosine tRNA-ribosyltransferase
MDFKWSVVAIAKPNKNPSTIIENSNSHNVGIYPDMTEKQAVAIASTFGDEIVMFFDYTTNIEEMRG